MSSNEKAKFLIWFTFPTQMVMLCAGITVPGKAQDGGERKKVRYGSRQRPKKPKQGQSVLEIKSRPHTHLANKHPTQNGNGSSLLKYLVARLLT